MSTPRILPGSILHLNAARAAGGTGAGSNDVPTSEWYDLSGNGNHGALVGFDYEAGDRPRTNSETDKALWHDLSGNGNDGTLTGFGFTEASGWATSPDRLVLDGVSDYVLLPDLSLAESKSFTYETLVVTSASDASNYVMVGEGNSASGNNYAMLWMYSGRPGLRVLDSTGAYTQVIAPSGTVISNGEPHHVIGTCSAELMTVYKDGASVGTPTAPVAGSLTINRAAAGVLPRSTWGYYWPGSVLVVRIYNRPLSAAEVAQNYAAGATGTGYVRTGLVLDFNAARAVRPSGWVEL
jgi:hypothetical protein